MNTTSTELYYAIIEFIDYITHRYPQIENNKINYAFTGKLSSLITSVADKITKIEKNKLTKQIQLKDTNETKINKSAKEEYIKKIKPCGDLDYIEIKNKQNHDMNPLKMREEHKNGDSISITHINKKDLPKKARILFLNDIITIEPARIYLNEDLRMAFFSNKKIIINSIIRHTSYKFINILQRRNESAEIANEIEKSFQITYHFAHQIYPQKKIIAEIYEILKALKQKIDEINRNGKSCMKQYKIEEQKKPFKIKEIKELYNELLEYDQKHDKLFN